MVGPIFFCPNPEAFRGPQQSFPYVWSCQLEVFSVDKWIEYGIIDEKENRTDDKNGRHTQGLGTQREEGTEV